MPRELEKYQLIERSISKKYRHDLWNNFIEAVKEYKLVEENDCICINLDGTAQSILIAKLFQHLKRVSNTPFDIVFKSEDDYSELNIPTEPNPIGYNKITSNECMSDVIEITLDNMLNNSKVESILPMDNNIIRPLYCITRDSISAFVRYNALECPVMQSSRKDTSRLLEQLEKENKGICHSIFRSVHALSLDTMIGYTSNNENHSFLYKYDE